MSTLTNYHNRKKQQMHTKNTHNIHVIHKKKRTQRKNKYLGYIDFSEHLNANVVFFFSMIISCACHKARRDNCVLYQTILDQLVFSYLVCPEGYFQLYRYIVYSRKLVWVLKVNNVLNMRRQNTLFPVYLLSMDKGRFRGTFCITVGTQGQCSCSNHTFAVFFSLV